MCLKLPAVFCPAQDIGSHLLLKRTFQDLLEGGHISEVVEGNAECHHVLTKTAQLALDQLCLSCKLTCKSQDRLPTQ